MDSRLNLRTVFAYAIAGLRSPQERPNPLPVGFLLRQGAVRILDSLAAVVDSKDAASIRKRATGGQFDFASKTVSLNLERREDRPICFLAERYDDLGMDDLYLPTEQRRTVGEPWPPHLALKSARL